MAGSGGGSDEPQGEDDPAHDEGVEEGGHQAGAEAGQHELDFNALRGGNGDAILVVDRPMFP